ncbi:putative ATP-BINDING CASSETTE TRANSPORTER, partial [Babesia divergens]
MVEDVATVKGIIYDDTQNEPGSEGLQGANKNIRPTGYIQFPFFRVGTLMGLHPLPEVDRISYWQPIFSKHVSDGLIGLEKQEAECKPLVADGKQRKPYRNIVFRALVITFWRRILLTIIATIVMSLTTVGTVTLLRCLLSVLSQKAHQLGITIALVISIVTLEVVQTFIEQHTNFYNLRLQNIMEASISITIFQHGLCHRRDYQNIIRRQGTKQGCKGAVHSYSENADCSTNPLVCPAKRHHNKELPPSMYTFLFVDGLYIVSLVDATVMLIRFTCNLVLGMVLIYMQIGMYVIKPMIIIACIILSMMLVEAINRSNIVHTLQSKDDRIAKSSHIIGGMDALTQVGAEDIGYNIITNCRSDELTVLQNRLAFFSINRSLMRVIGTIVYMVIILDNIKRIKSAGDNYTFDIAAPITILYIVSTIVGSFDHLLKSLKIIVEASVSLKRIETFIRSCSPNYYLTNHGVEQPASNPVYPDIPPAQHSALDFDTVVLYEKATFSWLNNRDDVLNHSNDIPIVF